jgi:L-rhamnose mutarotase
MIIALHTRLKPGHVDAYERDHARIPDELAAIFALVGIAEWRIWRSGLDLFHSVECDDWDRATGQLRAEPAEHAWQEFIGQHVDQVVSEEGETTALLRSVWTLSGQASQEGSGLS